MWNNLSIPNDYDKALQEYDSLKLDFPKWMAHLYDRQGIQIFMDGLSRGCENSCSFCKLNNDQCKATSKTIRGSNIDVIETIKILQSVCEKPLYIQFTDENFFGDGITRLREIQSLCDKLSQISYSGAFGIDSRLDSIFNPADSESTALFCNIC